jgi:hypothetical protein
MRRHDSPVDWFVDKTREYVFIYFESFVGLGRLRTYRICCWLGYNYGKPFFMMQETKLIRSRNLIPYFLEDIQSFLEYIHNKYESPLLYFPKIRGINSLLNLEKRHEKRIQLAKEDVFFWMDKVKPEFKVYASQNQPFTAVKEMLYVQAQKIEDRVDNKEIFDWSCLDYELALSSVEGHPISNLVPE